jgi:PrtD family type I secretion system ABC transporter
VKQDRSELGAVLGSCRGAFLGVFLMSAVVNVLYLTGSFFMLEVYDRVIPSRSLPTLVGLAVLALGLYAFQGALDLLRTRVLARIGMALDERLAPRVFDVLARLPLKLPRAGDGVQPLRDLDAVRGFLSGLGPTALFDLPWMPFYLGICFLFHPMIGLVAAAGALVLVALTALTEVYTRAPTRDAVRHGLARHGLAEAARRNAEVVAAMGMGGRLGDRWAAANRDYLASQGRAADVAATFGALSKVLRMVLQSGVLATGAYLVINGAASPGVIIAGSILSARALAPAELAIAHWKGFVAARQAWGRLSGLLAHLPAQPEPLALPAPRATVAVEGITVVPPGSQRVVVADAGFALSAGQGLGIIGPSASGKSSLARALVGVWTPVRGKVRLDGAALDQWSSGALGRHVGYLPQEVELFAGTVGENIARFAETVDAEAVVAAGRAAGVHELILRLPEGYDTPIGEGGENLSAGQRQRIGLARALYRDPFLVVLDEPNANLDAEGEGALTRAMMGVRMRGGIVVVIAHRPSALAGVDMVLMMAEGRVQAFGPKDEVLKRVLRAAPDAGPAEARPAETRPAVAVVQDARAQEVRAQEVRAQDARMRESA